jgi:hypothetical protein
MVEVLVRHANPDAYIHPRPFRAHPWASDANIAVQQSVMPRFHTYLQVNGLSKRVDINTPVDLSEGEISALENAGFTVTPASLAPPPPEEGA